MTYGRTLAAMIPIISLLLIVTLSILLTRIATIALTHTGISRQMARFQARSAFTGAGFTTAESEKIVNHPVRRRIVMLLMLLGNAGIVTAVTTLLLTFVQSSDGLSLTWKVTLLIVGLAFLWTAAASPWVDRQLQRVVDKTLRRYTRLDVQDYASILHLAGEYRVVELEVRPGDWLADRTLGELRLRDEGVLVLGIERPDGTYIGIPAGDTPLQAQDRLVAYGHTEALTRLDERSAAQGERGHRQAVREREAIQRQEAAEDPERGDAD